MNEIPELKVISKPKQITNIKSLNEIIRKRKILKIKLKLMQIYDLDQDLKALDENGLSLNEISLDNLYLTDQNILYVPLEEQIIIRQDQYYLKLRSYLIYLSYLYNFNFLAIAEKDPHDLMRIISSLNMDEEIKQNLFHLLNKKPGDYFINYIEKLNHSEFREQLQADSIKLMRRFKPNVK